MEEVRPLALQSLEIRCVLCVYYDPLVNGHWSHSTVCPDWNPEIPCSFPFPLLPPSLPSFPRYSDFEDLRECLVHTSASSARRASNPSLAPTDRPPLAPIPALPPKTIFRTLTPKFLTQRYATPTSDQRCSQSHPKTFVSSQGRLASFSPTHHPSRS